MYTIPNQPYLRTGDPLNRGLVMGLPMQEPNGPDTRDISGMRNHGTLVNGPTRVMTPMGRGIYCVAADTSSIATPVYINPKLPGSFFYWVRWVAISGGQLSGCTAANNRLYVGIFNQSAYAGCGNSTSYDVPHGMTAGNWYHVGLTWDGSLAECWIDGKKIVGLSYTSAGLIADPLYISKRGGGTEGEYESTATFTSATIHSRVLAPAEIRKLAGLDGDPFEQWRPEPRRRVYAMRRWIDRSYPRGVLRGVQQGVA